MPCQTTKVTRTTSIVELSIIERLLIPTNVINCLRLVHQPQRNHGQTDHGLKQTGHGNVMCEITARDIQKTYGTHQKTISGDGLGLRDQVLWRYSSNKHWPRWWHSQVRNAWINSIQDIAWYGRESGGALKTSSKADLWTDMVMHALYLVEPGVPCLTSLWVGRNNRQIPREVQKTAFGEMTVFDLSWVHGWPYRAKTRDHVLIISPMFPVFLHFPTPLSPCFHPLVFTLFVPFSCFSEHTHTHNNSTANNAHHHHHTTPHHTQYTHFSVLIFQAQWKSECSDMCTCNRPLSCEWFLRGFRPCGGKPICV